MYEVEDFEPYPCFPQPVPDPVEKVAAPEVDVVGRIKHPFFYRPPDQMNDVYSIFKVPHCPRAFLTNVRERPFVTFSWIFCLSRKSG